MNRLWGFVGNIVLGFAGLTMLVEAVLGHAPEIIVMRTCVVILASGLGAFFFRWWLERWSQPNVKSKQAPKSPGDKKDLVASSTSAVKTGR